MITFLISLALLIAGYFLYGALVERIFAIEPARATPAQTMADGVDYIPLKPWRIFLIQFLNIAGVGPIFGAIMGAKFGTSSFLWIVFGSIFAGAVHDYLSGMMSLRHNGASLPEIHGRYLGNRVKQFMRAFMVLMMVLVGVVFVSAPAELLSRLTSWDTIVWIVVIFAYYAIATMLPIDKIIGRIYPFFGICILFMVVGIMGALFYYRPALPEIWHGLQNQHPAAATTPIFPMMFISIACGAISGFHATQSPMMARCMTNERQGRPIFFGAMITEGIVALVWAAAATAFFYDPACATMVPSVLVEHISKEWLGTFGSVLALLGVVAAPITTGDTAFRSARLIVADFLHYDQKPILNRLLVAVPLFAAAIGLLLYSTLRPDGFATIWSYFSWTNQILAAVTLWAITVFLYRVKKCYFLTLFPAMGMTLVVSTFPFAAQNEGMGLPVLVATALGAVVTLAVTALVLRKVRDVMKD